MSRRVCVCVCVCVGGCGVQVWVWSTYGTVTATLFSSVTWTVCSVSGTRG